MAEIYFDINDTHLVLIDGQHLYYWYNTSGGKLLKNPYYRLKKLSLRNDYLETSINGKNYRFNRIVYQAFNPNWNIEDRSKNNLIDHIDRNKLNNDITNLRIVNNSQNILNSHRVQYAKGYCYYKRDDNYKAFIRLNKKVIHLGYFKTPKEAFLKSQKVRKFVEVLKIIYKNKNKN
tara:strand:+ start:1097 stop:1624 length:528 start_codon:yes stop_codon:yes gene_type:complete